VFKSPEIKVKPPLQPMLVSEASRIYNAVLEASVGVDAGMIRIISNILLNENHVGIVVQCLLTLTEIDIIFNLTIF
jgi:hypothetical protein